MRENQYQHHRNNGAAPSLNRQVAPPGAILPSAVPNNGNRSNGNSSYGFRNFGSNADAHSYIDRILREGQGQTGAVLAGFSVTSTNFGFESGSIPWNGAGNTPFWRSNGMRNEGFTIEPLPLHSIPNESTPPMANRILCVLATVDLPCRRNSRRNGEHGHSRMPPPPPARQFQVPNGLPSPSMSFLDSPLGSPQPSNVSGDSEYEFGFDEVDETKPCKYCGCTCHFYCEEHKHLCPVHGNAVAK